MTKRASRCVFEAKRNKSMREKTTRNIKKRRLLEYNSWCHARSSRQCYKTTKYAFCIIPASVVRQPQNKAARPPHTSKKLSRRHLSGNVTTFFKERAAIKKQNKQKHCPAVFIVEPQNENKPTRLTRNSVLLGSSTTQLWFWWFFFLFFSCFRNPSTTKKLIHNHYVSK